MNIWRALCLLVLCVIVEINFSPAYGGTPKKGDVIEKSNPVLEPLVEEIFPGYILFSYKEKTPVTAYTEREALAVIREGIRQWDKKWEMPADWPTDIRLPWRYPRIISVQPLMSHGKIRPTGYFVHYTLR